MSPQQVAAESIKRYPLIMLLCFTSVMCVCNKNYNDHMEIIHLTRDYLWYLSG